MNYLYFIGIIKFDKMKAINISILTAALLYSCTGEPMDIVNEYVVENISSHDVKLIVYERFPKEDNSFLDSNIVYIIPQNGEIRMNYIDVLANSPFGLFNDSASIIFDNIRIIKYNKDDIQARNILNIDNFNGGKIDKYFYQYFYYITNDDYENAIEVR